MIENPTALLDRIRSRTSQLIAFGLATTTVLLMSGCAEAVDLNLDLPESSKPSGFWLGLVHGWVAIFAWIGSLFNDDIAIYDIHNTGKWYDLGFLIGIGSTGFSFKITSNRGRRARKRRELFTTTGG